MVQTMLSPTHALPLPKNANHHTDVNITTLILEIQSLCHARDHPTLSSSSSSSSPSIEVNILQTVIRQKLHRLQDQILKRAMRKLEELLDYDLLPEQQHQHQHEHEHDDDDDEEEDEEEDDDGVLLPVPLKIGSRRVRARAIVRGDNNENKIIEDADMDPLERLERKVLDVQIYQC
ncbi:hypothetical protein PISL3812_06684 [Talaromyces islandicus]|uniref:Uncharacterized protein n=1 Tax=Talaromyces islandicus TaxID=28573 RepID=A0A0U1M241_TALIS|nr:hypothetical protein PISL3812_06684 [Talaromyces islandicus]